MDTPSDLQKLWERLKGEIMSGLRHGFFEYSIVSEFKNGKHHVTLKTGKSHKFLIEPEDINN